MTRDYGIRPAYVHTRTNTSRRRSSVLPLETPQRLRSAAHRKYTVFPWYGLEEACLTRLYRGVHSAPSEGWSCYQVLTTSDAALSFSNSQAGTTAFANPLSVAWQEADLSLFTPASAPILALSSAGITFPPDSTTIHSVSTSSASSATTMSTAAMSTTTSTNPHPSSGLNTGAAAGIGVGATIGGLALIGGLWWFTQRYKLTQRQQNSQRRRPHDRTVEVKGPYLVDGTVVEAPNTSMPYELDDRNVRAELDGGWQAPEAAGVTRGPKRL